MTETADCTPGIDPAGDALDAALAERIGGGDEAAVEELFERYRRPLYAYFNRMLNRDTASADDLFQELWIKVIRKLQNRQYRESGRFSAWLFRIARNMVLEHFRRQKSRARLGEVTDDGELPERPGVVNGPHLLLEEKELQLQLETLLNEMPSEQKEVFLMRQNDLSFKEIAEIQKCPLNTALGRMHNALKFLRRHLIP